MQRIHKYEIRPRLLLKCYAPSDSNFSDLETGNCQAGYLEDLCFFAGSHGINNKGIYRAVYVAIPSVEANELCRSASSSVSL